jgi:hypothetical protein
VPVVGRSVLRRPVGLDSGIDVGAVELDEKLTPGRRKARDGENSDEQ